MSKLQKHWIIFFIWAGAHMGFFIWYHLALNLEFSYTVIFFIFLVFIEFFLLTLLFRSPASQTILALGYIIFLLYAIVNFAYFRVFGTFLKLSIARLSSVNLPLLFLIKDFYVLIPWYAYLLSFFLFAIFVACLIYLRKGFVYKDIKFQNTLYKHDSVRKIGLKRTPVFFIVIAFFVALYFGPAFLANNVAAKVYEDGFLQKELQNDLGISGYIFLPNIFSKRLNSFQAETIQNIINDKRTADSHGSLPKSDIQLLRESVKQLAGFSPSSEKISEFPAFSQKPNIIIYQMESVGYWPLLEDPSPMPFLKQTMQKYQTVGEYFANGCTTIDSELVINCSFFPDSFGPVSDLYGNNTYNCLPTILKDIGYKTVLYHANDSKFWNRDKLGSAWGYEEMKFTPDFFYREDDRAILEKAIDELSVSQTPMLQYIIGMTSHAPHNEHFQNFYKDSQNILIKSCEGTIGPVAQSAEIDEDEIRLYFGFLKPVDEAIKYLFDRLDKENLKNNTIVVIFGDHRYYNFSSGDIEADFLNYNRIPLLLYVPGVEAGEVQSIATHLDIAPTLLQLVQGKNVTMPETFLGQSIFSENYHPYMLNACLGQASYYNKETLIKGDIGFNVYQTAIQKSDLYNQKNTEENLAQIYYLSDYLLKTNQIGGKYSFLVSAEKTGEAVDFDQVTDRDHDGLSDLREKAIGTNSHKSDTDNDGYLDGIEVSNGYDPLGPGKATESYQSF